MHGHPCKQSSFFFFLALYHIYFQCIRVDESPFTYQSEKEDKKAKGFRISSFFSDVTAVIGLNDADSRLGDGERGAGVRLYNTCLAESQAKQIHSNVFIKWGINFSVSKFKRILFILFLFILFHKQNMARHSSLLISFTAERDGGGGGGGGKRERERERERDRQTDRQTDRDRQRQTETDRDRQRQRQRDRQTDRQTDKVRDRDKQIDREGEGTKRNEVR